MSYFYKNFVLLLICFSAYYFYYLLINFGLNSFFSTNLLFENTFDKKSIFSVIPFWVIAVIISLLLVKMSESIKFRRNKLKFIFFSLQTIVIAQFFVGISGIIYTKYQIESSIINYSNQNDFILCIKNFYLFNFIGLIIALLIICYFNAKIKNSYYNKYKVEDVNYDKLELQSK